MKRILAVVVSLVVGSAYAQDKKPVTPAPQASPTATTATEKKAGATATATEPGSNMTCGQMAAGYAPIATKMADFADDAAADFETHAKWASAGKDKASKDEANWLNKQAKQHRQWAKDYRKQADELTKAGTMAQPAHDTSSPEFAKHIELSKKMVKTQKELGEMLVKSANEAEAMLAKMPASGGSGQ
jgi:hypothetical protein